MAGERLPTPLWRSTLALGFVSGVLDSTLPTAHCNSNYDWGIDAYSARFGGSMVRFGSSARIAMSNLYSQAVAACIRSGRGRYVVVACRPCFMAPAPLLARYRRRDARWQ